MRFAIASAILAKTLTTTTPVVADDNDIATVAASKDGKLLTEDHLVTPHDEHQRVKQYKKTHDGNICGGKLSLLPKDFFSPQIKGVATNNVLKNAKSLLECVPSASAAADIGVLSCGVGKYCMESKDSSLGGVCVQEQKPTMTKLPSRRRQQVVGRLSILELADLFCNRPEETGLTIDCNCTVDFENSTGDFTCYFGPDCTDIPSGCDDESFPLCSNEQLVATLEGPTSYSYTSCYTQTLPLVTERFTYCTDFGYTETGGPTCDIEVEGVPCNSCNIAVGGGEAYGENCEVFDCTNTISAYEGDRCGAFSTPTLRSLELVEYLYEQHWPCSDGCNLCGGGGRMTAGDSNFTYPAQFLEENATIPCYVLQYEALTGLSSQNGYCENLPPLVYDICGCVRLPVDAPIEEPSDTPVDAPAGTPTLSENTTPAPASSATPRDGKNLRVTIAGLLVALSFWLGKN